MDDLDKVVQALKDEIGTRLIEDKSVDWEDCCDGLEELEEFCLEWRQTIKSENTA